MKAQLVRCDTCGGVYTTVSGGSPYAHTCAPIENGKYQPDALSPDYDPRETFHRPSHRDENPPPSPPLERIEPATAAEMATPVADLSGRDPIDTGKG